MTSHVFHRHSSRRGVLLLLVLIVLTLFMMVGSLLLVIATRSRATARAFSDAIGSASPGSIQARAMLDESLMALVRGLRDPPPGTLARESLLEDKYGTDTISGSVTLGGNLASSPVVTATFSGTLSPSVSAGSRLAGRILTVKPAAGQGNPASFRILGVSGTTAYLANIAPRPLAGIVSGAAYAVCINGREFTPVSGTTTPEPYDGYDAANAWLAQPVFTSGSGGVRFERMSYVSGTAQVDNDNDGILDGGWITGTTGFLAPRPSPRGGSLRYRVSYLVLDLDGRININAAGMPEPLPQVSGSAAAVPLGMGYGPADLDASLVMTGSLPVAGGTSAFTGGGANAWNSIWGRVLRGGVPIQSQASANQRRKPPAIGQVTGRYGVNLVPGANGDDTQTGQMTSGTASNPTYRSLVTGNWVTGTSNTGAAVYGIADLKGQLQLSMTSTSGQPVAQLTFLKSASSATFVDDDYENDPYEMRLDADGRRLATAVTGSSSLSDDNPFTLGDLERLLRANDADASALPPRQPALLEDRAQAVRLSITSDSWDTPALTGTAARILEDAIATSGSCQPIRYPWATDDVLSPDVAAGLRFDLNRAVSGTAQKSDYCRGLYTLTVLLGETNQVKAAQWAANVLDFRDEDSTMTRFDYDTNLADGWNPSGTTCVFGAERPEVVIAQTAAWKNVTSGSGELFVNLYRPPRPAVVRTGSTTVATVERLDPNLGAGDNFNIAKMAGANPVWQLRFDTNKVAWFAATTGTTQNQFRLDTSGTVASGTVSAIGPSASANAMPPGDNLCVQSGSSSPYVATTTTMLVANQGGVFSMGGLTEIELERLVDPNRPNAADNPYVVVDKASVNVVAMPDPPAPPVSVESRRRPDPSSSGAGLAAFWQSPTAWTTSGTTISPYSTFVSGSTKPIPWFHWPNRPFVSQAELALVPAESPPQLLRQYSFPTSSLAVSATSHLLDATYVPSLFAGNSVAVSGSPASNHGLDKLGIRTFSKWREPGRVNVNTIVSSTATTVDNDSIVWATLLSGTSLPLAGSQTVTTNPFVSGTGSSQPAISMGRLLSLQQNGTTIAAETPPTVSGSIHPRSSNPFLAYATPIRMANTATVRSNVFAVWITLEITDDGPTGATTQYRRLFAIIDRSIPVGFSKGEDLNVRDTIRLMRYLE